MIWTQVNLTLIRPLTEVETKQVKKSIFIYKKLNRFQKNKKIIFFQKMLPSLKFMIYFYICYKF
jgi:hypothetical protein